MEEVLGNFIHSLRQRGLPISPAETLDGIQAAKLIGLSERSHLKAALAMTLTKTLPHKLEFDQAFDQFFDGMESHTSKPKPETDAKESDAAQTSEPPEASTPNSESSAEANQDDNNVIESELGQQLLSEDDSALQLAIAAAGTGAGAKTMKLFTQKGPVSYRILQAMGDGQLSTELSALELANEAPALANKLRQSRRQLQQQVANYVERQYLIYSQAQGLILRDENLQKIKFTNIDQHYQQRMAELVRKSAKQLASMHSRRRKVSKRGLLDVRKTIAANAAFDGFLFHTKWKATRIERPKVMVICDVSGSVSRVARFLLLFLYSLQDVLPRVRSFVFASNLGEVTELFEQHEMEDAIGKIISHWANMPTDYGRALQDFADCALKDIDNKTTVIMLGDARNNNIPEHKAELWQQVYQRSKRVLWLNPENNNNWNTGDSIMHEYAAYCSRLESCNSLRDLNRILSSLLKHSYEPKMS